MLWTLLRLVRTSVSLLLGSAFAIFNAAAQPTAALSAGQSGRSESHELPIRILLVPDGASSLSHFRRGPSESVIVIRESDATPELLAGLLREARRREMPDSVLREDGGLFRVRPSSSAEVNLSSSEVRLSDGEKNSAERILTRMRASEWRTSGEFLVARQIVLTPVQRLGR